MSKPHVTLKNGIWYASSGKQAMGLTAHCAIKSWRMLNET
jgi:hypothetical protein